MIIYIRLIARDKIAESNSTNIYILTDIDK